MKGHIWSEIMILVEKCFIQKLNLSWSLKRYVLTETSVEGILERRTMKIKGMETVGQNDYLEKEGN